MAAAEYNRANFQPTPAVPFQALLYPGAQPELPAADANTGRYKLLKEIWSDNSTNYKAQQRDIKAFQVVLQASLSETVKGKIGDPVTGLTNFTVAQLFARLRVQYGTLLTKDYTELRQRINAPFTPGTMIQDHVAIHTKIHQVRAAQNQSLPMETQVHLMHASISKVPALQDVYDQWIRATPAFADQALPSLAAALIAADNADLIPISAPTTSSIGYSAAVATDTISIPAKEAAAYRAFKAQGRGGRNHSGRGDRNRDRDTTPSNEKYCWTHNRIGHSTSECEHPCADHPEPRDNTARNPKHKTT